MAKGYLTLRWALNGDWDFHRETQNSDPRRGPRPNKSMGMKQEYHTEAKCLISGNRRGVSKSGEPLHEGP